MKLFPEEFPLWVLVAVPITSYLVGRFPNIYAIAIAAVLFGILTLPSFYTIIQQGCLLTEMRKKLAEIEALRLEAENIRKVELSP